MKPGRISQALALALLLAGLLALGPAPAAAYELSGVVRSTTGAPLSYVMLTLWTRVPGPTTITVLSAADGSYHFPAVAAQKPVSIKVDLMKVGFVSQSWQHAIEPKDQLHPGFRLKPTENVADDASAQDWLDTIHVDPGDEYARVVTTLTCTGCHTFPNAHIRELVSSFKSLTPAERQEAWTDLVHKMGVYLVNRALTGKFVDPHPMAGPYVNPINPLDTALISGFLAKYMPTSFNELSLKEWNECCSNSYKLPPEPGTIMKEWQLPVPPSSWTREVVLPLGSKYVYGTDMPNSRLFRLDPATGQVKFIPMPKGYNGVHTLFPDSHGYFWGSIERQATLMRFDPRTETFKIFPSFKIPGMKIVTTHDIAFNDKRQVALDYKGRVWVSLIADNYMGVLDPKTGEEHVYPANQVKGRKNPGIYGVVMTSDRKHIWYAQVFGDVGEMSCETGKVLKVLDFKDGAGPRRPAIDNQDRLWIGLHGLGKVVEYDTKAQKVIDTIDMPSRYSSPYAMSWDAKRDSMWAAGSDGDSIYRLDLHTMKWIVYRAPRRSYFRVVPLDSNDNIWGTYAEYPEVEGRYTMVLELIPGPPTVHNTETAAK